MTIREAVKNEIDMLPEDVLHTIRITVSSSLRTLIASVLESFEG